MQIVGGGINNSLQQAAATLTVTRPLSAESSLQKYDRTRMGPSSATSAGGSA